MEEFKISNGKTVVKGIDDNGRVRILEKYNDKYYKLLPNEYEEARELANSRIGFEDYTEVVAIFGVFIILLYVLNLINQGLIKLKERKAFKVFKYILLFFSITGTTAFIIFSIFYFLAKMLNLF